MWRRYRKNLRDEIEILNKVDIIRQDDNIIMRIYVYTYIVFNTYIE